MRQLPRRIAPLAAILTGLGLVGVALAPAAHADTDTVTYLSTGSEQTFQVPDGVTSLQVTLVGGRGGSSSSPPPSGTDPGGFGAIQTGTVTVTPNETLYVEVGGNGQDGTSGAGAGGFNGGGTGGSPLGAGGGGESDLRTVSAAGSSSLSSVLFMAAGGGGAAVGGPGGSASGNVGSPGGPADQSCVDPGGPGNGGGPGSPGNGGSGPGGDGSPGTQGAGGAGATSLGAGGGGGAGWYGGGGGGGGANCGGGGGAGGSYVTDSGAAYQDSIAADTTGKPRITISYVVPLAPQATTEPASDIGVHGATLNGVVNAEGADTSYQFQWGTTTGYGGSTTPGDASGSADQAVSFTVSGLASGTTYHFRLVATNATGPTNGSDLSFTTAPAPPVPQATTEPASNIGPTRATLNGVVNPEGADTSWHFNYGTTTSYSNGTSPPGDAGSGNGQIAVSAQVTGLTPSTTYHFQLAASSTNGTAAGGDVTFTTPSAAQGGAPLAVTRPAGQIGRHAARLNGQVNAEGSATHYYFQYGKTSRYGDTTSLVWGGSGTSTESVHALLSGLARHTLYHFRLVAVNSQGTTYGVDQEFKTK